MYKTLHYYSATVIGAMTNSVATVLPVAPVPPAPTSAKTIWKFGLFPMFIPRQDADEEKKRIAELLAFFKDPQSRATLEPKHVLCALHNPGLALDLIVLYNVKGSYDLYVKAHYQGQYTGANRDRLYDNLSFIIEKDENMKTFIHDKLSDTNQLLRQVLEDHRLNYSPQAFTRNNPDTLSRLNALLRERQSTSSTTRTNP